MSRRKSFFYVYIDPRINQKQGDDDRRLMGVSISHRRCFLARQVLLASKLVKGGQHGRRACCALDQVV